MPTRAGWAAATAGLATIGAGRLFGFIELYLLGGALIVLVLAAVAHTTLTPLRLEVGRAVRPSRVHVGDRSQVVLTLRNDGPRRTPVLRLYDAVRGTPGAVLHAAPLERGATATAAYLLPTDRRGELEIGPLSVELGDPFGLARASVIAVGRTTAVIFPRVVDVAPPGRRGGVDPHGHRSRGLHHEGDEFRALRPYEVGDDLRRVHWPATARHDELVVRQLDRRHHGRTTVQLETRGGFHRETSFDRAVEVAASLLVASHRRGDELRLLTSDGHDSGIGDDDHHLDALLRWLATAEPATGGAATTETPRDRVGADPGSAEIHVTTDLDPVVGRAAAGAARTFVVRAGTDRPPAVPAGTVVVEDLADLPRAAAIIADERRLAGVR